MNVLKFVTLIRQLPVVLKKSILIFLDLTAFLLGSLLVVDGLATASSLAIISILIIPVVGVVALGFLGLYRSVASESSVIWLMPRVILVAAVTCSLGLLFFPENVRFSSILQYLIIVISCISLTRTMSSQLRVSDSNSTAIAIYGAGEAGLRLSYAIQRSDKFHLVTFVDDNSALHGRQLGDTRVISLEKLSVLISTGKVEELVIAIPSIRPENVPFFMARLNGFSIPISRCPNLSEILRGSQITALKSLNFDEFLGRTVVPPIYSLLGESVKDKVVLVTGAGGSIGSELCRKICGQNPAAIILLDHSEHSLYELERALRIDFPNIMVLPKLMSVLDENNLNRLFHELSPKVVFHAAAYKHVPLFEENVRVGIHNNIYGTLTLVKICELHSIDKSVLVSTDKAVRPTNVMGATKRVCELIVQARAAETPADGVIFCMVRFGNVLGSSGSVIPLFQEQINMGGPVTVTSLEMTRFFMSISEAAELVLQASSLAKGGEVFVLDMGDPVKIIDLAKSMIKQSPARDDIEIKITGLRPGEKLYEELLIGVDSEATSHKKIMRAYEDYIKSDLLNEKLIKLADNMEKSPIEAVMQDLRDMVPDYVANSRN